jgi:hypothetical protein
VTIQEGEKLRREDVDFTAVSPTAPAEIMQPPMPPDSKPAATLTSPPPERAAPSGGSEPVETHRAPGDRPDAQTSEVHAQRFDGWQTLAVDVLAGTIFVYGVSQRDVPSAISGYGLFLVGTPIVHLFHHHENNGRVAGFDWLLRIFLPTAGLFLGSLIDASSQGNGLSGTIAVGTVAAGATVLIDALVWGYEPAPHAQARATSSHPSSVSVNLVPVIGLGGSLRGGGIAVLF